MATLDIEAQNYRESGKKYIGSVVAKLQDVNDEVSSIKIENKSRLDEAAPPTASIATNINAAAKPKVLKALRHRKQFSAVVDGDKDTPVITDAKLLSDELLVVADARHWCLKLFDTHGKYNCSRTCSSAPYRLARIVTSWDFSDVYIHTMALTRPNSNSIDLFEVTRYEIKLKATLEMQASYEAIATVDQHTLAVGYGSLSQTGIDLINLNGQVLYQISPFIEPFYMDCADGLDLMCSTPDDEKVLIVNVLTGRILTDNRCDISTASIMRALPQLMKPSGVTNSSCGSLLIADGMNRTLHLAFARADWAKTIWTHPQGGDQDDQLSSVSVYNGVCICATERGSLFVLDDMP
ncbi:hypothetical protein PoB_003611000 [Plakobranchus ocellatus]|uniref:Uncharacterized protein n=1 Tax=Plakobranchus ocellatus TaxID=259542 RepID=A0AAV4AQK1_9GAST|nr:hypothetical protein PoB_003611000 [Plakobranchus ocellatus]